MGVGFIASAGRLVNDNGIPINTTTTTFTVSKEVEVGGFDPLVGMELPRRREKVDLIHIEDERGISGERIARVLSEWPDIKRIFTEHLGWRLPRGKERG